MSNQFKETFEKGINKATDFLKEKGAQAKEYLATVHDKASIAVAIAKAEADLEAAYKELGKYCYEADEIDEEALEFANVENTLAYIEELKAQLEEIENESISADSAATDNAVQPETVFCSKCGVKHSTEENFCSKCGAELKK